MKKRYKALNFGQELLGFDYIARIRSSKCENYRIEMEIKVAETRMKEWFMKLALRL